MASYDNNSLGVGNPNHPANLKDTVTEEFEYTNNLVKAFNHYKISDDEDILKDVIDFNTETIKSSIKDLTEIIIEYRKVKNDNEANKLCRIREKLNDILI